MKEDKTKVYNLFQYEIYEYSWGTAVKEKRTGKWVVAFIRTNARELSLEGIDVELHENGIEFI